jgi:hypothetical protein
MSFQVTTAFVRDYHSTLTHLAQQKGSRLRKAVRVDSITGEYGFYDQLSATAAVKKTSRHMDTPLISTPHARRMVTPVDFIWADLLDSLDKVKMLTDPASQYAQSGAWALGRSMDDQIIAAANGTSLTGVDGGTSTVLPSAQKVAAASAGLTLAKLISAKEIFGENDVDEDLKLWLAVRQAQISDLLGVTEVKSADYNTVKALVEGSVNSFMGFEFIRTQRLSANSGATGYYNLAWAEDGILLALGADIMVKIEQRPDKNYAWQAYAQMSVGATRMEEEKVVEIDVIES